MAWGKFVMCIGMLLVAITRCHCVALSKMSSPNPSIIWKLKSRGNSTRINTKEAHGPRGRLFIGRDPRQTTTLKEHLVDADYQSDMELKPVRLVFVSKGWPETEAYVKAQVDGAAQPAGAAVQRLMQAEPNVECTGDSMKLKIQGSFSTPEALFVVDRGSSLAPLPLSDLPSSCGYTLKTTHRDLVLAAPYDGCFVSLEEEDYVLPLRWWGIPVRMSCPVMRRSLYNPPTVTCNTSGMVVKTEWASPVDKIKVNLNGQWELLMEVLPRCGFDFNFAAHPGSVSISIRYVPCVKVKDGMFTLGLAGDGAVKVSCPSVQIVESPGKDVLPTVAPLWQNPNIIPAGTPEGQKQNPINQPPKPQVPVTLQPKNPVAPEGQNMGQNPQPYPFPYYFWPPQPSQAPDLLTPGPLQKPASPTPKTEVREPVTKPKPPKTHVNKNPVAPEGQKPQPYPFPYFTWPPQPPASQTPDPFPPYHPNPFYPSSGPDGPSQKPASPTPKTEVQEPVTQPKPPKTHVNKNPVAPEGQKPQPYPFPYFTWPPQPPASQTPDPFPPYHPNPFYPPSGPDGPSQKPTSPKTEVQEPQPKPPKTNVNENPVAPEGQNPQPYPFPYYFWPPQPSAPDQPFYPPPGPDGPSQKPASPTPKTEVQEPVTQPKPPKTNVNENPVAPEGQNPQPYPFPYYFWPPQPSAPQAPDQPFYPPPGPDGPSQKPASPKTEVQEPVTQPKPPKTHVNENPVAPEGQNPQPYPFPYYFWPPQPSAPQAPDQPFYPPPGPDGPSQKPASPTPKTEVQEPVTQPKPPKTNVNENPVAPEGQNPQPYPFPYYFWPPQPSAPQAPDQPFYPPPGPDGPSQKPASPTPKTEVQEPVTQPKPPKTHVNENPVAPEGQNPQPYPFPYYFWPPQPSAPQAPDQPFYPLPGPDGPSQKPASPTPKTEVQEPVTQPKPPKTHGNKNPVAPEGKKPQLYPFPYFTWPPQPSQGPDLLTPGLPQKPASPMPKTEVQEPVTKPKPPKYEVTTNLPPTDPLATVGQTKPSKSETGPPYNPLVQCPQICPSGLSDCCVSFNYHHHNHYIYPLQDDRKIAPFVQEDFQGTPRTGPPDPTEASHDTVVNPDKKQSQSQTPVNQGRFMILDPGMVQYNIQDAQASSGLSTDYFEAVQPLSNSKTFEKLTSERPLSNGYVLLEHGPPGSDLSAAKLAARGLGRSHTHLPSEPLSNYQQSKVKSHLPQPGNQMDTMYRSEDRMTGQEPHYVPLSYPAGTGQFQSNHNLGQQFEGLRSSVDGYPNGDMNQPFPRNSHGK